MELKIPGIGSENAGSVSRCNSERSHSSSNPLIPEAMYRGYAVTAPHMIGDLLHKCHPVRLNPNLARCFLPIGPITESLVSHSTFQLGRLLWVIVDCVTSIMSMIQGYCHTSLL